MTSSCLVATSSPLGSLSGPTSHSGEGYLPTYNSGYGVTQRQAEGFTDYKHGRGREQYGVGLRLSQGIRCMPEAMKCTKEFVMAKT